VRLAGFGLLYVGLKRANHHLFIPRGWAVDF